MAFKKIKEGERPNIMTSEYVCNSIQDRDAIPNPKFGDMALVVLDDSQWGIYIYTSTWTLLKQQISE